MDLTWGLQVADAVERALGQADALLKETKGAPWKIRKELEKEGVKQVESLRVKVERSRSYSEMSEESSDLDGEEVPPIPSSAMFCCRSLLKRCDCAPSSSLCPHPT